VVAADFDGDGWPDIFVANDGNANQLWINQRNGTFKNIALLSGVAFNRDGKADAGMGVDAGDFNGDGLEDLFLPHLMEEMPTLFVNLGKGFFEDGTRQAGLALQSGRYTGFGTSLFDFDNDGWLDLVSVNGAVYVLMDLARSGTRFPFGQPNQLFRNQGNGRFVDISSRAGKIFQLPEVSRGAAFGDVDNDGDIDILINNNSGPARLFLNREGSKNPWIGLRLLGGKNGRDMLGARVKISRAGAPPLWRRARTDGSYCSAQDPRVLAGLGTSDRIESILVFWPTGSIEEWKDLPIRQYHRIAMGGGKSVQR
jgi:hypothetical protein